MHSHLEVCLYTWVQAGMGLRQASGLVHQIFGINIEK
jgi:hypothetical protein